MWRDAHPAFAAWKSTEYTSQWCSNFSRIKKNIDKLEWGETMPSEEDKDMLGHNAATLLALQQRQQTRTIMTSEKQTVFEKNTSHERTIMRSEGSSDYPCKKKAATRCRTGTTDSAIQNKTASLPCTMQWERSSNFIYYNPLEPQRNNTDNSL